MEITCLKMKDLTLATANNNQEYRYVLPGETFKIKDASHNKIEASDIIKASPDRVKVICPIFYACGGCDYLHMSYDAQLKLKESHVRNLYEQEKLGSNFLPIIKNDEPLYYRHKIVASATTHKQKLRLGLYQEGSKKVIPFTRCFIQDQDANQVLETLEVLFNTYKIPAYDIDSGKGIVKHVLIRKSYHYQKMLVTIVTQGNLLPNAKKIAQDLIKKHHQVETVVQNIHNKKTHLVLLDDEKVVYGKGYIEDKIDDMTFRLSSKSFFQVNPVQMIKLYQVALDQANIKKTDVVLDTYSGIGTISLLAAKRAKHVIAVETNQASHLDALNNKRVNQVTNLTCIHDDVSSFLRHYQEKVDVLIMDPTRDGASKEFLDLVLKVKPKKIIYISCEPKTQVRDIKTLSKNYKVYSVQAVDMFSQTQHVESITLLSLKNV
jgi:23S rRNA (uracil1939-C5)-methyltransferase